MTDPLVRTQFRIPAELYDSLARAAKESQRSTNGELVRRLADSLGEAPTDPGDDHRPGADARYPSEHLDKFIVRMPTGMRAQIAELARKSGRSMTAEVVAMLSAALGHAPRITAMGAYGAGVAGQPIVLASEWRKLEFQPTDDGMVVHLLSTAGAWLASSRSKKNELPHILGRDLCVGEACIALGDGEINVVGGWIAGRFGAKL